MRLKVLLLVLRLLYNILVIVEYGCIDRADLEALEDVK